jgi:hypothetical protein
MASRITRQACTSDSCKPKSVFVCTSGCPAKSASSSRQTYEDPSAALAWSQAATSIPRLQLKFSVTEIRGASVNSYRANILTISDSAMFWRQLEVMTIEAWVRCTRRLSRSTQDGSNRCSSTACLADSGGRRPRRGRWPAQWVEFRTPSKSRKRILVINHTANDIGAHWGVYPVKDINTARYLQAGRPPDIWDVG